MDLVADALTRIKNGYLATKSEVALPYSKLISSICEVLTKEGYIDGCKVVQTGKNNNISQLVVTLKYHATIGGATNKKAAVADIKRISKPGLRVYKGSKMLPYVLNGLGVAIISTPKGVMTDKQARKEKLGGEVLAYIW